MHDLISLKNELSSLNLLLVDDEEGARKHMAHFLSHLFKTVYEASSAKEALHLYENLPIDITITDIAMPVMSGFELIDELHKRNPRAKVIVMSAQSDKATIVQAITYSVYGYILKPIDENQIFAALDKTVKELKSEREHDAYQVNLESRVAKQDKALESFSSKLIYQLEHDRLTGLPNKQKMEMDYEYEPFNWVLLVNIDNLQYINLAYGAEEGDKLIYEMGIFLNTLALGHVYRINGDEFFITSMLSTREEVEVFAREIHEKTYYKRFALSQINVRASITIGIVEVQGEERLPYHKAHLTLKQLRKNHKNSVGFYQNDTSTRAYHESMNTWASKTKLALELDLVRPYFQPMVNVKTCAVEKFECLARIMEQDEAILPSSFIEPMRVAGLMVPLTKRILLKAFDAFAQSELSFSINITEEDLKEHYLVDFLQEQCARTHILPEQVVLEVLENISDEDANGTFEQLEKLHALGFQIAVDDFGAQSSNFARLQQLHVHYIKIDGNFIKNIVKDAKSENIVKTIIYYAQLSGLKTVAEYVHSQEVYDKVVALGIDYAQGYYLSKPLREVI